MNYVAISFPVTTGPTAKRKNESLRLAKKFAASLGADDSEITSIREGVYGFVVSSDVDAAVLTAAGKLGGRVTQFVESEVPQVKEGTWVSLSKAALGIRFSMAGTTASNPEEGRILPGKYYVLGISESNGGTFATLGRVDRLEEIGRANGPGRYTYNVDLTALRESLAKPDVEKAPAAAAETKAERDRSDEILDMLLENDPHVQAEDRASKSKKALTEARTVKNTSEDDEPSLEDMINAEGNQPKTGAGESQPEGDALVESEDTTEDTAPAEASSVETVLPGEDTSTEETKEETDELDEEMDPELFAMTRDIAEALQEQGIDIDSLSDEQLDEAIAELMAEEEGDAEQGTEEDAPQETEQEQAEDGEEDAPKEAENKVETDLGNKPADDDDAFETAGTSDIVQD